jgi:hypothetical protein
VCKIGLKKHLLPGKLLTITAYGGNMGKLSSVGPSSRRGRNGTVLHGAEGIASTVVSLLPPISKDVFYVNPS